MADLIKYNNTLNKPAGYQGLFCEPGQVFDPVKPYLSKIEAYSFMTPEIDFAYENNSGDVIFQFDIHWYLKPVRQSVAYQLPSGSFSGQGEKFEVTFESHYDPAFLPDNLKHENRLFMNARMIADGYQGRATLQHGTETQHLTKLSQPKQQALLNEITNREIEFIGLPEIHDYKDIFISQSGEYFITTYNKVDAHNAKFKFFKGKSLSDLKPFDIHDMVTYMDGGTTYYHVAQGVLFAPRHWMDQHPTWTCEVTGHKERLTRIDKADLVNRTPRLKRPKKTLKKKTPDVFKNLKL